MTMWRFFPDVLRRLWGLQLMDERFLSRSQFQRALQRERMRADRLGSSFSFVEFRGALDTASRRDAVVRVLDRRLRLTDEFGEFGSGWGVILPETPRDAACKLAREISDQVRDAAPVTWRVFEYPGDDETGTSAEVAHDAVAARGEDGREETCDPNALPLLFAQPLPLWKRAIDVVVASAALICVSPVLLMAAVAIKCTSPGPVLFTQRRTGLGGRPFTIYKLRTMRHDAESLKASLRPKSEQDGPAFKMKNDPRVTAVGRYLRVTCIDELPQLWNVLMGDMTLVGPRPLPCDEADGCSRWQRRRLDVTPGLTCIWQVSAGRARVPFADWMRMDLSYIRRRSLWQDLRLLWKTFVAVILHRASH